jgi:hypothetical protein
MHKQRRIHLIPMMIATLVLFVIVGVMTCHGVEAWLLTDEMDFMRFFYLFIAIIVFLIFFLAYMYLFAAVFRSYEFLGKLRRGTADLPPINTTWRTETLEVFKCLIPNIDGYLQRSDGSDFFNKSDCVD